MSAPAQSLVGKNLGMWGSQGVTFKRKIQDQQLNPGAITGNPIYLNTNKLSTSGYLRNLTVQIPPVAGFLTVGTGTFAYTANNMIAARLIRQIQLSVGNVNNLINLNSIGIAYCGYVGSGNCFRNRNRRSNAGVYGSGAAPNVYPFVAPLEQDASNLVKGPGALANYGGNFLWNTSTTNITAGYRQKLWITEMLRSPNTIMAQFGNAPVLGEQPYEFGLLPLQNSAQNVGPTVQVNALYGPDGTTPILVTGNATATYTPQINLATEYYDVPRRNAPIQEYPTPYQMQFAVTRIQYSVPVSGGNVSYIFANAGFLFRAGYIFYNDSPTGNLVDAATLPAATKTFKSANIITRSFETFQENMNTQYDLYGEPSPGFIVDDFLTETGTDTDFIDTSLFTQPEAVFTGLTGVTRMEVVEERMIPVGGI